MFIVIRKIKSVLNNPFKIYMWATYKGAFKWVPDKIHLQLMYRASLKKKLNLNNPKTFNEKLQWLKLHDRNPLYTKLVDKHLVKQWVAERIGSEYVTPTYAKWDKVDDIDIEELPERFVLKTNHDCGGVVICDDRMHFDIEQAKELLKKHLSRNYYWGSREWPYKNVNPVVFAEEYIEPDDSDLYDYKLFRFNNGRTITLVCTDRFSRAGLSKTFFDEEWNVLEMTEGDHSSNPDIPVPKYFEKMKDLANTLAAGMPFVRVDFYEAHGRLRFGEMTFYPNSGCEAFNPSEWDETFGSWITLPVHGCQKDSSTV